MLVRTKARAASANNRGAMLCFAGAVSQSGRSGRSDGQLYFNGISGLETDAAAMSKRRSDSRGSGAELES